jgi:hypothetical protein
MFLPGTRQVFAVAAILTVTIPLSASSAQSAGGDTPSATVAPILQPLHLMRCLRISTSGVRPRN